MRRIWLCLVALIGFTIVAAAAEASPPPTNGVELPHDLPAIAPPDDLRERCVELALTYQPREQLYVNMALGTVMGGGVGALAGSFLGFTVWGLALGGAYGAVVGYFGGNSASEAIRTHLIERCMARGAPRIGGR